MVAIKKRLTYNIPQVNQKGLKLLFNIGHQTAGKSRFGLRYQSGPIIKDNVAIFVGNVAWEPRKFGERWNMGGKLFAVKSPEPLLDITDEVIWRWSKKNGIDFEKAQKIAVAVTIEEKENQLEIRFAFWGQNSWPRIVSVDWNQISDIMREVKEKGVAHKDLRWGTSYIEKEFKPDVQK